jgi:hypothetical protein
MSAIDEGIVREYFEQNGFLVRQLRKYDVTARKKTGDEEIDLLVYNPAYRRGDRRPDFFLFSSELAHIHRAIVVVKGWHTGRFTPKLMMSSPELFNFLQENVLKEVSKLFPPEPVVAALATGSGEADGAKGEADAQPTKILVLPSLPTAEPFRSQSLQLLKERGVDAIISFRAMLLDLIDKIEANRSYGKSDTLQVMRILKNYDLLKEAQLDLPAPAARKSATPKAG